ncbi:uncharacterized protein LOC123948855 [Meles meles]|uniref:uncharacterized protein LOC123948855 n=1 Tax=Meles meles TaxID=9662 RepID=UPI001E69DDE9|nr:uncharacterized protein LOC123948855 [Meles meles]
MLKEGLFYSSISPDTEELGETRSVWVLKPPPSPASRGPRRLTARRRNKVLKKNRARWRPFGKRVKKGAGQREGSLSCGQRRRGGGRKRRAYVSLNLHPVSESILRVSSVQCLAHEPVSGHKPECCRQSPGFSHFSPLALLWKLHRNTLRLLYKMFAYESSEVPAEILESERLGFNSQLCYGTLDKLYALLKLRLFHSKCFSHERKGRNVCENLGKVPGTSYNPEFQLIRLPDISRMFALCRGLSAGC